MRILNKFLLLTLLPFFSGVAHAHPGHGIEYSLTTLIILVVAIAFLSKLYNSR